MRRGSRLPSRDRTPTISRSDAGRDLVDAEAAAARRFEADEVIVQARDLCEQSGISRRPTLGLAVKRPARLALFLPAPSAVERAAEVKRLDRRGGTKLDRLAALGLQRRARALEAAAVVPLER